MQRVSDIISEVEKQVRSLKRQLAQARRHRRYTDELKELEIALGRREYADWQTRKHESAGRIAELRRLIRESDDVLSSSERDGMGVRTERHDKEEALGSLEIEIAELDARSRSLADGLLVGTERRNASERRVAELDTELTDIRANLSLALARAARLEDQIKEAAARAEERDGDLSVRGREPLRGREGVPQAQGTPRRQEADAPRRTREFCGTQRANSRATGRDWTT